MTVAARIQDSEPREHGASAFPERITPSSHGGFPIFDTLLLSGSRRPPGPDRVALRKTSPAVAEIPFPPGWTGGRGSRSGAGNVRTARRSPDGLRRRRLRPWSPVPPRV